MDIMEVWDMDITEDPVTILTTDWVIRGCTDTVMGCGDDSEDCDVW